MNTPDTLSEEDLETFYRLKHSLYLFVNEKVKTVPAAQDWKALGTCSPEKILKLRNYVFKDHRDEIDRFVEVNQYNFSKEDLDIVSSWKQALIADKFIITKYEKEHAIFFGQGKVFGVKGLMDSFRDIFDGHTPVFIDLIILPFKGFLVHEGLFMPYNIVVGGSMSSGIKAEAEESMVKNGVITSFDDDKQHQQKGDDADLLRFYLKSDLNRDKYFSRIDKLRKKSPELGRIYNYEIARINAKHIKKQLKEQKISGHFAILFSQVIASGATKKELENNLQKMLPEGRMGEVYQIRV